MLERLIHRFVLGLSLLCLLLGLAAAADAPSKEDLQKTTQTQLELAGKALEKVRKSLEATDSQDTLQELADSADKVRVQAHSAVTALEPMLTQLDARIQQLGIVEEGAQESEAIAAQRKELGEQRNALDASIKQGKLLSVEAQQTIDSIEKVRTKQFSAEITTKVASPLSPSLWVKLARELPADTRRMQALFQQAVVAFNNAIATHGWEPLVSDLILALILVFPVRILLRQLGQRLAKSPRAPAGRLRRSGLALWLVLVGTVLPGMANLWVVSGLDGMGAIPPRLEMVAMTWVTACSVGAFIVALSGSLFTPKRPSWRLLDIDDAAAPALHRVAWSAATLTAISMVVNVLDVAARTSITSKVAVDGVVALAYVALIGTALLTLNRQRQRQLRLAAEKAAEAPAATQVSQRGSWLMAAWLGCHITVLGALLAALLGYLNFAEFLTTQMVWLTVVVLATSLLSKFFEDLCTWLYSQHNAPGQNLHHITGLSASRIEQIGVLLSALLRVGSLLLGVSAVMAPFGNVTSMLGWTGNLAQGITIGDATLKPWAVVRALAVLGIGLTVFRVLHQWLTDTYLPKTQLDIGARNSVSTVARYVGIIVSVLWTLAALGIGLERIALLASALSVGIGFGLQAITQNFVSGLILLAERPVRLGDRVRIGDQVGDIRRISVRATEIQTDDKSTLIVPNSELITKSVQNLTKDGALGRISIIFSVPLNTNIVQLKALLLGIYAAHDSVLETPPPAMYVDSIQGGQITINSSGHVQSPRSVYSTRSDLLFELLRQTAEHGIQLASPTDIHVVQSPPPTISAPPKPPAPSPTTSPLPPNDAAVLAASDAAPPAPRSSHP